MENFCPVPAAPSSITDEFLLNTQFDSLKNFQPSQSFSCSQFKIGKDHDRLNSQFVPTQRKGLFRPPIKESNGSFTIKETQPNDQVSTAGGQSGTFVEHYPPLQKKGESEILFHSQGDNQKHSVGSQRRTVKQYPTEKGDGDKSIFHLRDNVQVVTPSVSCVRNKYYTPSPIVLAQGSNAGSKLKSVQEIDEKYQQVFKFPYFNIVQTKVFDEVFYTDKSIVVCAPTGAGKTVVFELAIIRLLMKKEQFVATDNWKIVYMAPIKALCSERYQDWKEKFEPFGLKCQEMTGDTEMDDFYELQQINIIFTTPEKWDSMTRRWRDHKFLVQSVCLFFIDEIHVLHDATRGATMEAVISRMKTIQASVGRSRVDTTVPYLRFIAVSATIPNIEDIAEWLSENTSPASSFNIDESLRPVRLRKVVLGFQFDEQKGSDFHFDMSLSYKLSRVISTYSEKKPTLVFCSTRKSTQQAAEILAKDMVVSFVKTYFQRQALQTCGNSLKDNKLRDLVVRGIAYHHAGMDLQDRKAVEEIFYEGQLMVLVATSTLAMGVNLPAHLVVVKSTSHYNMGVHTEYSDTQILQMIGRAGRPQFDETATAVIMTKNQTKLKYETLINGTQVIESSLHKHLIEHLNAEIVLHTINDISVAMEWIRYTFLYIRVMKNPRHYGMPVGLSKEQIERKLQELCMRNLNQLNTIKMITMDEETIDVKPTESGRLMARYCISFETMKNFSKLGPTATVNDLLVEMSGCEEFAEIQLRTNEKKALNTLNKDKNRMTIRYQLPGKIKTKQMKVNVLIQSVLGCLTIQDFSLQQDSTRIFRAAQRMSRCLVEFMWLRDDYRSLQSAILLCKCLKAKLWENSDYVTKQLDGIGPSLSNAFVNAGISTFQKIAETNPRELELIVNRHPPFGNQLRDMITGLPKYELAIEQVSKYSENTAEIIVHLKIANEEDLLHKKTVSENHTCVLLIGDEDNKIIYKRKIMDLYLIKDHGITKKLEVKKAEKGTNLYIDLLSKDWVGLDVQSMYTPYYIGAKKMSNIGTGSETSVHKDTPKKNPAVLPRTNKGSCHSNIDRSVCTQGTKRKQQNNQKPSLMASFIYNVKNRAMLLQDNSSYAKRLKISDVPSCQNSCDLQQFAYNPQTPKLNLMSHSLDQLDDEITIIDVSNKTEKKQQKGIKREENSSESEHIYPSIQRTKSLGDWGDLNMYMFMKQQYGCENFQEDSCQLGHVIAWKNSECDPAVDSPQVMDENWSGSDSELLAAEEEERKRIGVDSNIELQSDTTNDIQHVQTPLFPSKVTNCLVRIQGNDTGYEAKIVPEKYGEIFPIQKSEKLRLAEEDMQNFLSRYNNDKKDELRCQAFKKKNEIITEPHIDLTGDTEDKSSAWWEDKSDMYCEDFNFTNNEKPVQKLGVDFSSIWSNDQHFNYKHPQHFNCITNDQSRKAPIMPNSTEWLGDYQQRKAEEDNHQIDGSKFDAENFKKDIQNHFVSDGNSDQCHKEETANCYNSGTEGKNMESYARFDSFQEHSQKFQNVHVMPTLSFTDMGQLLYQNVYEKALTSTYVIQPIDWVPILEAEHVGESCETVCVADATNIHERVKEGILIPLTILIIVINVVILLLVAVDKRFHNPKIAFIATLGLSDLFVGIASIGTLVTHASENTLDRCLTRIGFTICTCVASIISLMFIAIERFIAVTFPLNYKSVVTTGRVILAISLIWIFSIGVGFAPLVGWRTETYDKYCSFLYVLPRNYIIFTFIVAAIIPFSIMFFIYIKLFRNARGHIKKIEAIENIVLSDMTKRNGGFRISRRSWRSLKTLIIVFGCVIVTWTPFLVASFIQITIKQDMCILKDIVGTHLLVLGLSNSFLNPLIYVLRTRDFQEHMRERLCRKTRRTLCLDT